MFQQFFLQSSRFLIYDWWFRQNIELLNYDDTKQGGGPNLVTCMCMSWDRKRRRVIMLGTQTILQYQDPRLLVALSWWFASHILSNGDCTMQTAKHSCLTWMHVVLAWLLPSCIPNVVRFLSVFPPRIHDVWSSATQKCLDTIYLNCEAWLCSEAFAPMIFLLLSNSLLLVNY